jgi:hypothetical protein
MIHARDDYNRMQDPALEDPSMLSEGSTAIGTDEPVCLFRAQDKHMVAVLQAYRSQVELDPDADASIPYSVTEHIYRVKQWQARNGCKTPDL